MECFGYENKLPLVKEDFNLDIDISFLNECNEGTFDSVFEDKYFIFVKNITFKKNNGCELLLM